jgi:prepilin-type processing-associated H-X9-DG protein
MNSQLSSAGGQIFWMRLIDSYVKGGVKEFTNQATNVGERLSIYICPNYDTPAPDVDEAGNSRGSVSAVGRFPLSSYTPNVEVITAWWDLGISAPRGTPGKMGSLGEPAQIVLLAEGHDCCVGTYAGGGNNEWTRAGRRHSAGANYALCDGHVKWYRGGVPHYGRTADGEWPSAQVCTNKYLPTGQLRPGCSAYFKPRGG